MRPWLPRRAVCAPSAGRLRAVPGIGPVSVAALLADCPELGRISHGEIAALVGLAPLARDSGQFEGRRSISGGRKPLRDILYMAGLSAARSIPALKDFRSRMKAIKKPAKQINIAVARKLLIILNAMMRSQTDYSPALP